MTDRGRDRSVRRRRLWWAGILAVVGLALLLIGLIVASGTLAWVEVVLALVLLVGSYMLQRVARRETLYRNEGR
ncbi:hypothetical protein [Micromonospora eburnea]|uniref:Uncharacterized protein n=1 Tax=Micromonospora eburnea TaxID=227316 RepID=A0A1C6UDE8_9ACTN|nr:hypothetical protein [Micromonospora eburnea]SCL52067.1 hypothetical protein GA0070604_2482 [Micromonospora eburnea]